MGLRDGRYEMSKKEEWMDNLTTVLKVGIPILLVTLFLFYIFSKLHHEEFIYNNGQQTAREFLRSRGVVANNNAKLDKVYQCIVVRDNTLEKTSNADALWRSGDTYFLFTGEKH
jgi:hypothetical protein